MDDNAKVSAALVTWTGWGSNSWPLRHLRSRTIREARNTRAGVVFQGTTVPLDVRGSSGRSNLLG